MRGHMAIAMALPEFSDHGRSVTLIFLSKNTFHLRLSKNEQNVDVQS